MEELFDNIGPENKFQEYLENGKFMIQKSTKTEKYFFYPRVINPNTGENDLEWVEASGIGIVYAATTTSRREEQGGNYNISIVKLKEGPKMMTKVIGIKSEDVKIGMQVNAEISEIDGKKAIVFRPGGEVK